jgi:hypothetical protein
MTEWRLRIGTRLTGLVVLPDIEYPELWRIHYKGQVSDTVNLTRAKDASVSWVRPRGLGGHEAAKWDGREMRGE